MRFANAYSWVTAPTRKMENGPQPQCPFCPGTVGFSPTRLPAAARLTSVPAGRPLPETLPRNSNCVCGASCLRPPPLSRTPGRFVHLVARSVIHAPHGDAPPCVSHTLGASGHFQPGALTKERMKFTTSLCCKHCHTGLSLDLLPFSRSRIYGNFVMLPHVPNVELCERLLNRRPKGLCHVDVLTNQVRDSSLRCVLTRTRQYPSLARNLAPPDPRSEFAQLGRQTRSTAYRVCLLWVCPC